VQVVVFADFECPYCAQTAPTLDKLEETFRGDVAIVFRHYPLSFHASAGPAAEAATCAGEQGRFWDVHDALFGHKVALDQGAIRGFLQGLDGFDVAAWDKCLADGRGAAAVRDDLAAGERAGVDGTPAFFVNGVKLGGARPYEDFEGLVRDELARLGR
jgi:protein-disulfide isomerase